MARLLLEYGVVWYSPDARFRDLVRYKNLHYLTDLTQPMHACNFISGMRRAGSLPIMCSTP